MRAASASGKRASGQARRGLDGASESSIAELSLQVLLVFVGELGRMCWRGDSRQNGGLDTCPKHCKVRRGENLNFFQQPKAFHNRSVAHGGRTRKANTVKDRATKNVCAVQGRFCVTPWWRDEKTAYNSVVC